MPVPSLEKSARKFKRKGASGGLVHLFVASEMLTYRPYYFAQAKEYPGGAARVLRSSENFPVGPQVSMPDSISVLILAREELIAALLGLLVETTGHSVSFGQQNEGSADAVRRLRPGVVIVDCDHRDCTGALVKAAKEVGAKLILFSASREPDYVRRIAAPSRSDSFTFPIEPPQLDSLIRQQMA